MPINGTKVRSHEIAHRHAHGRAMHDVIEHQHQRERQADDRQLQRGDREAPDVPCDVLDQRRHVLRVRIERERQVFEKDSDPECRDDRRHPRGVAERLVGKSLDRHTEQRRACHREHQRRRERETQHRA